MEQLLLIFRQSWKRKRKVELSRLAEETRSSAITPLSTRGGIVGGGLVLFGQRSLSSQFHWQVLAPAVNGSRTGGQRDQPQRPGLQFVCGTIPTCPRFALGMFPLCEYFTSVSNMLRPGGLWPRVFLAPSLARGRFPQAMDSLKLRAPGQWCFNGTDSLVVESHIFSVFSPASVIASTLKAIGSSSMPRQQDSGRLTLEITLWQGSSD